MLVLLALAGDVTSRKGEADFVESWSEISVVDLTGCGDPGSVESCVASSAPELESVVVGLETEAGGASVERGAVRATRFWS